MSYVDKSKLKGVLDPNIPFFNTTQVFTTAVLTIDTLTQFGAYYRAFRIVNQDALANCSYRQVSATDPLKPIPPSSELRDQGWESFLQITPNAVSGTGFVELELVSRADAERTDLKEEPIQEEAPAYI